MRCIAVLCVFLSGPRLAGASGKNPSPGLEDLASSWLVLKGAVLDSCHVIPSPPAFDGATPRPVGESLRAFRDGVEGFQRGELFAVAVSYDPSIRDTLRDMRVALIELDSWLGADRPASEAIRLVEYIDTRMIQLLCANYAFGKTINRSYLNVMYVFLAMVLLILLALALFRARIRRAQQAEANSTEYTRSVIRAHEEERRKLARELHDTVVQDITGVKLKTEALSYAIARHSKKYVADFESLVLEERRCIERIRRVCYDLRPPELDYLDLRASLAELCCQFDEWAGISCSLECGEGIAMTDREKINAYRIVQELLANVRKHARATRVRVEVSSVEGNSVRIAVRDNGCGVTANVLKNLRNIQNRHFGLRGIKERVDILGGSMRLARAEEGGTEAVIEFPLTAADSRDSITISEFVS